MEGNRTQLFIGIGVLIIIALVAYFIWPQAEEPALEEETSSVTELPSVNPVENTNPFENTYKNPFE